MLGEKDLRGNRRIGHIDSISDRLWKVPLLFIHPNLPGKSIDKPAKLQEIRNVICKVSTGKSISSNWITEQLTTSEPIIIECPPRIGTERLDEFDISQDIVRRLKESQVVVRHEDWTIVYGSITGTQAWKSKEDTSAQNIPSGLLKIAKETTNRIVRKIGESDNKVQVDELSRSTLNHLEELGYR